MYDVIKNVMLSTVPEKKRKDSKAEQFRFYVFTRMRLRDNRMKIHADLTDYVEPNMFRSVQFADGLRNSELEKSAVKVVTVRVVHIRPGTSKLCFL